MQRFFLAIAILSLGGCALPKKEYVPYDMVGPAICDTERQCQAMWLRATTEISTVSGMKVRLLTDTYIETFDGTVQGRMLGKVEKIPLQNGKGYMITPFLYCRPKCGDLPQRGQSLFNAAVKASGSGLGLNDGAKP